VAELFAYWSTINHMIFRQLYDADSSTFTYLLADPLTKEAVIIDSVKENLARDLQLINQLGIKLVYTLETHIHADHITASKELSQRTGAKTVVPWTAQVPCADILLKDGDTLRFGQETITAIYTPGHTNTCMSYLVGDRLFTGDALLIRGTGRTDFQSGSATELYNSIKNKLYTLPDQVLVFPGHDYKGMTQTSIGEEKFFNPRINNQTTQAEFVATMQNLKLADPKKIHEAVPANLQCGTIKETPIKPAEDALYIDVRSLDEYRSGSVPGAICIPHDQITQQVSQVPHDKPVVLYCRSGKRSAKAKEELNKLGYDNISEIEGGFMAWQSSGNPVFKARQAISIQRQVMIVAGFLGFLGTALGYLVRPEYYALSAFVGAGLMFAGISGFCGMALLLEKMPWNQINDESCSEPSCAGSCSV
jgi:glyoxylase-like metal-dependent hydrolase (beta-lactamase superfamily II)/rhodanese-related sulfurtransferase